jgi:hypothetical protein
LGSLGRILQCGSELRDGDVDRVIEVAKALGWPDPSLELLALNYFPCSLQEYSQYLERLVLKPDGHTCFSQFSGIQVGFIGAKPDSTSGLPQIPPPVLTKFNTVLVGADCRANSRLGEDYSRTVWSVGLPGETTRRR